MSLKTQRSQLQQLIEEVLDAAPDGETKKRQRPVTQKIFHYFKQLKEQIKVTPEELEAEQRERRKVEADLSATKSALVKQERETQDAVSKVGAMLVVIRKLRSCLQSQALTGLASALVKVHQLCIHEELSSQYKSETDESFFQEAINTTYLTDEDTGEWFSRFTLWLRKRMEERDISSEPDSLEEYRNHMTAS